MDMSCYHYVTCEIPNETILIDTLQKLEAINTRRTFPILWASGANPTAYKPKGIGDNARNGYRLIITDDPNAGDGVHFTLFENPYFTFKDAEHLAPTPELFLAQAEAF